MRPTTSKPHSLVDRIPQPHAQIDLSWKLRKAKHDEWPSILRLQSEERRPSRADSQVSEYFVALVGSKLVGCVALRVQGEMAYLYGLLVAKRWRRVGIGHALTHHCVRILKMQKIKKLYLLSMFWNIRFFRKHGFSLVDREAFSRLTNLHGDFGEDWCRRSALLCLTF